MTKPIYYVEGPSGWDMSSSIAGKGIYDDLELAVAAAKDDPYGATVYEVELNSGRMRGKDIWGYRKDLLGKWDRGYVDNRDESISPEVDKLRKQAAKLGLKVVAE